MEKIFKVGLRSPLHFNLLFNFIIPELLESKIYGIKVKTTKGFSFTIMEGCRGYWKDENASTLYSHIECKRKPKKAPFFEDNFKRKVNGERIYIDVPYDSLSAIVELYDGLKLIEFYR